jgi:hypothetical protein
MFCVIGIDRFHRIDNLAQRFEGEQSRFATIVLRETRFLNYDGSTGRKIARAPVAEPPGV